MRFGHFLLCSSIVAAFTFPAAAATRPHHHSVTSASGKTTHHLVKAKVQSQRSIDDDRATQIQEALIKAGYLSGAPSGHWDAESVAAMTKFQADNGWQTKLAPDSRALIKLGLGPGSASAGTPPAPAAPANGGAAPQASLAASAPTNY